MIALDCGDMSLETWLLISKEILYFSQSRKAPVSAKYSGSSRLSVSMSFTQIYVVLAASQLSKFCVQFRWQCHCGVVIVVLVGLLIGLVFWSS